MLYAKVFRSTFRMAASSRIDISAAEAVEGVYRVVTGEDIRRVVPEPYYGPAFHDQPVLAIDKVRHVGEPVAVVLAADPHVAAEAAELITAEYEELPAVFDEVEAVTSRAIVHDVLKPAGTFPDLKHLKGRERHQRRARLPLRRGDVDAGLRGGRPRVRARVPHPAGHAHAPRAHGLAGRAAHDTLTIHTASQSPSFVRIEIARLLGWPENRVRVKVPFLGGGFGAKLYIKLEALVACLVAARATAGEDRR